MKNPRSAVLAGFAGLAVLVAVAPLPGRRAVPVERTIRIEASSFAYAPATIRVNRGDRVNFELVATDVVHGLYIDGYGLSMTADPGETARLNFVADRPGSFRFRCSVACGPLHPFMVGKLTVGPNLLFWRAVVLAVLAAGLGILMIRR